MYTDEYILLGSSTKIFFSEMSDIKHRGGNTPAFVFEYKGKRVQLPYSPLEKTYILPFFIQAIEREKERKRLTQEQNIIVSERLISDKLQSAVPNEGYKLNNSQSNRNQMQCPRCGSHNVLVHNTEKHNFKQSHGCLWLLLFGWIYVCWLAIKWMYKISIACAYWVFWGWISRIIQKTKGMEPRTPMWYRKMMRRHGKMYSDTTTHAVCQDCGNSWTLRK